jgi:hypothetical protein
LRSDEARQRPEVKGAGVVGKQPVLAHGESFKYSSWNGRKPTGLPRLCEPAAPGWMRLDLPCRSAVRPDAREEPCGP